MEIAEWECRGEVMDGELWQLGQGLGWPRLVTGPRGGTGTAFVREGAAEDRASPSSCC